MNHLVIIVGGTGAGKSFILSKIVDINKTFNDGSDGSKPQSEYPYCVVKKYTTRPLRANESEGSTDLFCNAMPADFEKCGKFVYTYGSHCYGIDCEEIDKKLANDQSPIVIVRDFRIVELLKQRYNCAIDIYCKSGLSQDDLKVMLRKNGASNDEITARMNNIVHDDNQWLYSNNKFYDYIVNRYDENFIPAIISSLQRAPKWNFRQITIIAAGESRLQNIDIGVETANRDNNAFDTNYFEVYRIDALKADLNNPNSKENLIGIIKRSWLTIIDITFLHDSEDSHGLYRLVNIVFNNKHGDDKLVIADNSMSQSIPFDIVNNRVYFYDMISGSLPQIIRNQIQGLLGSNA